MIGTEVPTPGGAQADDAGLQVTEPAAALETIELFRQAFLARGLDAAWARTIALVVQPGVEFGDEEIHEYDRGQAAALSRAIETQPGLVYEAHSTDYQTPAALRQLVEDHFAILKVGPGLTFAFREAVFALAQIEEAWLGRRGDVTLSRLPAVIDEVMVADPRYWLKYYPGAAAAQAFARQYSLSDRIRYYWPHPDGPGGAGPARAQPAGKPAAAAAAQPVLAGGIPVGTGGGVAQRAVGARLGAYRCGVAGLCAGVWIVYDCRPEWQQISIRLAPSQYHIDPEMVGLTLRLSTGMRIQRLLDARELAAALLRGRFTATPSGT